MSQDNDTSIGVNRETVDPRRDHCAICDSPLTIRWADSHGVGKCCVCNAPHMMRGYRGQAETQVAIRPDKVDAVRGYWQASRRPVMPHAYMLCARDSHVTEADDAAWSEWAKADTAADEAARATGGAA